MIPFKRYTLPNGLVVLLQQDNTTPIVAINLLYKVGSRNESPQQTGLAHLFEHLMFGGSKHVKDFDTPIQQAGGENNAFTNNDITDFYCTLPAQNIDTAFWLESDRMAALQLTQQKLNKEKKVVIEEFKETCLNEPYGDVWHHLSRLVYQQHPYRWPVIGEEIPHIKGVDLEDARTFYKRYYHPANAILSVSGPVQLDQLLEKVNYWFGDIPAGIPPVDIIPAEPVQQARRFLHVHGDVPAEALYMAFRMDDRLAPGYYRTDLVSDILSNGRSSRLYQHLVKDLELFTHIDAYITGTWDPGMLVIEGKMASGKTLEQGEAAVWAELDALRAAPIGDRELQKLKNKVESTITFQEISVMQKAINLGFFEVLGDADLINREVAMYRAITASELHEHMADLLTPDNCSVLYYSPVSGS